MRKLLATVTICMTMTMTCRATQPGASLRLADNILDLGDIEQNSIATDSMKIYNDGSEPLVITSVFTDCHCTAPSYTRAPIAPGDSGVIAVSFNSRGRAAGKFRKVVRIRSNSEPPTKILFVTGRIKRPYVK